MRKFCNMVENGKGREKSRKREWERKMVLSTKINVKNMKFIIADQVSHKL